MNGVVFFLLGGVSRKKSSCLHHLWRWERVFRKIDT